MDGQSIALWAALVGLAAVLLDRRARGAAGSGGGLTVRGADVSIDASNKVEEAQFWQYNGTPRALWWQDVTPNFDGRPKYLIFDLVPGKWYDMRVPWLGDNGEIPIRLGGGGLVPQTKLTQGEWDALWIPGLLTVQEQNEARVIRTPETLADILKRIGK